MTIKYKIQFFDHLIFNFFSLQIKIDKLDWSVFMEASGRQCPQINEALQTDLTVILQFTATRIVVFTCSDICQA